MPADSSKVKELLRDLIEEALVKFMDGESLQQIKDSLYASIEEADLELEEQG